MASTGKCEYCGATITSEDQQCPQCGAPNPNYVPDGKRTVFLPKTIEELKEYCAERGMPLLRMRFFIGEDYKEPKAFGIYQDGAEFVVYKNKANGVRAVRYRGTDEEYAVNEIFQKLLEECHNRGIYPDGKPGGGTTRSAKSSWLSRNFVKLFLLAFAVSAGLGFGLNFLSHHNDGYYLVDHGVYYHYGGSWYEDTADYGWIEVNDAPVSDYSEYYVGTDYNADWGGTDFKSSEAWQKIEENHSSSSSDYDSWDSSDTDWDSDW